MVNEGRCLEERSKEGRLAQLVERLLHTQEVTGSRPVTSTKKGKIMTPERKNVLEGIKGGISIFGRLKQGESLAEAMVRYGEEDKITIEEANEFLGLIEKKAA